jgi:hypothetical protein
MKRHHVYCTCCIHWKKLSQWEEDNQARIDIGESYFPDPPEICESCYIDCPWDSRSPDLRKNYKESLSGWWWLTKREMLDHLIYIFYKIRKIIKRRK